MRNAPLILLIAFFALDAIAPRLGMVQVSVQIWNEGWAARLLVAAGLLVLTSHVLFQWPMPPTHKAAK